MSYKSTFKHKKLPILRYNNKLYKLCGIIAKKFNKLFNRFYQKFNTYSTFTNAHITLKTIAKNIFKELSNKTHTFIFILSNVIYLKKHTYELKLIIIAINILLRTLACVEYISLYDKMKINLLYLLISI